MKHRIATVARRHALLPMAARTVAMAALSVALAACSADGEAGGTPETPTPGGPVALRLTADVAPMGDGTAHTAVTRANYNAETNLHATYFPYTMEKLYLYLPEGCTRTSVTLNVGSHGSNQYNPASVDAGSGETPFVVTQANDKKAYGYYPGNVFATYDGAQAATERIDHWTVAQNQSSGNTSADANANYRQSDLLFAVGTISPADGLITTDGAPDGRLRFQHQMSRLKLSFINGDGGGIASGCKVTGMYLLQGYRTIKLTRSRGVNISGGTLALGTNRTLASHSDLSDEITPANPLTIQNNSTGYNTGAALSALVPPQELSKDKAFLRITVAKTDGTQLGHIDYQFTEAQTLEPGKEYTLPLYVTPAYINQTVTIQNWTDGGTIASPMLRQPMVGDLYFSDGTWGTLTDNTSGTTKTAADAIGIVFSTQTSTKDRALGYQNGYVMALKNASTATNWCASVPNAVSTSDLQQVLVTGSTVSSPFSNLAEDKDGLTHCRQAVANGEAAAGWNPSNLTAIASAMDYTGLTAPIASSGWYLPSSGQLCDILTNLGGLTLNWSTERGSDLKFVYMSEGITQDDCKAVRNAINTRLGAISGADLLPTTEQFDFVSSTEYSAGQYWAIFMDKTAFPGFDRMDKSKVRSSYAGSSKTYVRPVLAF